MKDKKVSEIVLAICLLVFGMFLIIWAERITKIVSIMLGIVGILYAVMLFVNYFKKNDKTFGNTLNFIYGIFILIIGCILIFRVNFLNIVLSSTMKLHEILTLQKKDNVSMKKPLIITLILIFLGLLCILGKFLIPDLMVRVMGVILVIYSIMMIVNAKMVKKIVGGLITHEE